MTKNKKNKNKRNAEARGNAGGKAVIHKKAQPDNNKPSNNNNKQQQKQGKASSDSSKTSSQTNLQVSQSHMSEAIKQLQTIKWSTCQNSARRNVMRLNDPTLKKTEHGKPYVESFIFGVNMKDPSGGLSYFSTANPKCYKFLDDLIQRQVPGFKYTHITVNRNLRCARHMDKGNAGDSYICGFGDYSGGGLNVEKVGGGNGKTHDIRGKLLRFDGKRMPHETMEFKGERFTAVWYTSDIVPDVDGETTEERSERIEKKKREEGNVSVGIREKLQAIKDKMMSKKKK